jgi:hypothetical protein
MVMAMDGLKAVPFKKLQALRMTILLGVWGSSRGFGSRTKSRRGSKAVPQGLKSLRENGMDDLSLTLLKGERFADCRRAARAFQETWEKGI